MNSKRLICEFHGCSAHAGRNFGFKVNDTNAWRVETFENGGTFKHFECETLYSSCHGIFHLFDLEMISTSIHESRDVSTLQNIIFIKIMKSYFPFY